MTIGNLGIVVLTILISIVVVSVSFDAMRRARVRRASLFAAMGGSFIVLWLTGVTVLSMRGWLSVWDSVPPRVPMFLLGAIGTYSIVCSTRLTGKVIALIPIWLPISIQTFRVAVEMTLWRLHQEGSVPVQFTFERGNIDVIPAITAPLVAWGIAKGRVGPNAAIVWNMIGLASVVNAIVIAGTSSPGPQHLDWPGREFTEISIWPLVWLPTFLAPTAVFLHMISLRQCMAIEKSGPEA